jgi:hypothetical protein
MHKPSQASVYGIVGLTFFGVGYDCGLFGNPDGHDHSAVISVASASSSSSVSIGYTYLSNGITGEEIPVIPPGPPKPTQT